MTCPLCTAREQQNERLLREVHELRLALAESRPTTQARQDLERVNLKLAEANATIAGLKGRLYQRKAS